MAVAGSLQLSYNLGLSKCQGNDKHFKAKAFRRKLPLLSNVISSRAMFQQDHSWRNRLLENLRKPIQSVPSRSNAFKCHSSLVPGSSSELPSIKDAAMTLMRSFKSNGNPLIFKLASAVGIIIFVAWGLGPLIGHIRNLLLHKNDNNWKKSTTHYVMASYIQPLLLWTAALLICRVLDPVVLPTEASQVVKHRLLNFVRSFSTVLAFAFCLSSVIQQAQKFFMESPEPSDTRNMGLQFAGRAVYSAVWVAAFSLFMELLGFSTQKWVTAGGLGTVLLTLAGREIFTNFLSSAMIHATRPFVVNEWIQTKIEGYEVSGTVEHVGWWSPTIVRGEDREAVHIPNHKFTVNVVRNLSQKTHWRIKTHLAISHLDVHKISNIVADMRKVLAKNPQVEQQKLHRRVFLDNVNPENQALLILVSCFVKTSHYEEYLCVKDAILLDLLRVISHHRARLATPIRTVQKIYSDTDLDNVPFADSIYSRGPAAKRPLLLIEPSYRINGEDKTKPQTRSGRSAGEQEGKMASRSTPDNKGVSLKSDSKAKELSKLDVESEPKTGETSKSNAKENMKSAATPINDPKLGERIKGKSSASGMAKKNLNVAEESSSDSKGMASDSLTEKKKQFDGKQRPSSAANDVHSRNMDLVSSSEAGLHETDPLKGSSQPKQAVDGKSGAHPSTPKPALEENIVLGVALEGSKRTLPIDEVTISHPTSGHRREMAATRQNGTSSPSSERDTKDSQIPKKPNTASDDQ